MLIVAIVFFIIAIVIAAWPIKSRHDKYQKVLQELIETEQKLSQALLEVKAMRTLYAKDAQDLIRLRTFKNRFDALVASRKENE